MSIHLLIMFRDELVHMINNDVPKIAFNYIPITQNLSKTGKYQKCKNSFYNLYFLLFARLH